MELRSASTPTSASSATPAELDESALILAALGGRLRPEDVERAKTLGNKLTLARAACARAFADQMSQHAGKVPANKP